jgi:hypothetical protein
MVVILMSSKIEGLTRTHIMPYWWMTAHWQAQFVMDVYCPTDISLNTVKSITIADDRLRYCPSWAAAKKRGWPKEDVREKSVADHIKESAKKKRTRRGQSSFAGSVTSLITTWLTVSRTQHIN